jgi:hypothetical protein
MPVNYYYDIHVNKFINKKKTDSIILKADTSELIELSKQIYIIIHDIRKQILHTIDYSIKKKIYDYFDNLYNYYVLFYNDIDLKNKIRDFCNGYKDIYIIYLCWLIKIYNEPGFIFVESDNEKKYFVYYSPFRLYCYIYG